MDPHKGGYTSVKGTFGFSETSVARQDEADRRTAAKYITYVDIRTLRLKFLIKQPFPPY